MPFDNIGRSLDQTLRTTASLFQQIDTELIPETRATLSAAQKSFNAANATLAQDSPLRSDVHQALTELRRTLASLNSLADYCNDIRNLLCGASLHRLLRVIEHAGRIV
ncbi:hypothetical protein GCT13_42335 [Paraburkholderia sp. CNPSo 3157]|uniref:Uncharacterized protein n=1 Tax=Paraburkholderia franconis TaxID=2654983 RepID=A0A7X1TL40_9BURK|nr:hypothetical protein [Paraburkholderia franconis]MPW23231.1 hypothetical protein [Paraburkholderia franconis]